VIVLQVAAQAGGQDPRTAKTPGDKACPATAAGAARAYERSDFDSLKHRNGA